MEHAIIRLSIMNLVTIGVLSGAAYLGVTGAALLVAYGKSKSGMK
jgi:hypothetical protein